MLIPNAIAGTPVAELLGRIESAADARGLFVKREWVSAGWESEAKYTVLRGEKAMITLALGGAEGKTLRAKSSAFLQGLLTQIEEIPTLDQDELPTEPITGNFLLTDAHRAKLHDWNVRWDKSTKQWVSPKTHEQEALAFLADRAAVSLGRLTRDQEQIVKSMVPAGDRQMSEFGDTRWEYAILVKHESAVREALRRNDTWVSLGSDFPREANDDLREAGARWDGSRWTARLEDQAAAETIIARYKQVAAKEREREIAALKEGREAEKAAGIVRWSNGSGYGAESIAIGELIYRAVERNKVSLADHGGEALWYMITECDSTYYREDGMSFGVGDDSGRIYHYAARPATEAEYAEAEAERLEREARREAKAMVTAALRDPALFGRSGGEYPSRNADGSMLWLQGEEVVIHPNDLHGGGDWFVIDADGSYLWYVQNNGADGDDWSRDNVSTGGAGAIGFRYQRTPERDLIIEAARAARKGVQ